MWKPQSDSLIFKAVLREQVDFPWSSHLDPGYPQRMPPAAEGFLPWVGVSFLGQCGLRDRVLSHYPLFTPEAPPGFYFSLDVVNILLITFPTL